MNKQFFDENEKRDFEKLIEFNERTGLFTELTQLKEKYHADASGYTINKFGERRNFNIELKNRNLNLLDDGRISGATQKGTFIDDTVYIEAHKAADLLFDLMDGLEPLYINFLQDGKILIYNLSKLTKRPMKTDNMNIKSVGYGRFEMAKREGLYIKDAAIYDSNYNLIKRAGEEWITK